MKLAIATCAALLAGCAATSSISPTGVSASGSDTFMLSKQAATGFTGLGNLKGEILEEANAHCARSGKRMQVVSTTESSPPFILGNYPRAEVQFACR